MGDPISQSQYLKKNEGAYAGGVGETFYHFMFTALYSVEYRVIDNVDLTVQERDDLLAQYHTELQNAISEMSRESLTAQDIKGNLQMIAKELTKECSTDCLIFENAEIQSIEILDENQEYRLPITA